MTATRQAPTRAPVRRADAGRAVLPAERGVARSPDGVRIAWETYGSGERTLLLLPSTPIVHSRQWKGQIPYLSRTHRVVVFDGRGNGLSDRPADPDAYREPRMLGDIEAVMDATGTDAAVVIGLCGDGVWRAIEFAATRPERVQGIVAFAAGVPLLSPPHPWKVTWSFDDELDTDEGWAKLNRHYWRRDYPGFARFFFEQITSEPHSTKVIDDAVEWALDGSVDAMIADMDVEGTTDLATVEATCRAVRCPMLIVHGTEDTCQPIERSRRLSELTGAPLVEVERADHMIPGRHPVLANLLIRDFVRSLEEGVS
jgi:pimeloyl-ACP methyl ester carboxylesterase